MVKIAGIALSFVIVLSFCILPSLSSAQPSLQLTISSSGSIIYPPPSTNQIKILRQTFQNWEWSASKFASITDVYQAHYNGLDVYSQIKEINPEVLGFVYYNSIHVWKQGSSEYEAEKLQTFIDNDWIMKDSNGNYVNAYSGYAYYVDFGNPGYQSWLANWAKKYIAQYSLSGVSIDNWFCESSVWYYVEDSATPVNPRTGSAWTNQQICDAFKSLTLKVKQEIGSNKIVLVNGVYNGNHFFMSKRSQYYIDGIQNGGVDAVMSEAWVSSYDASAWYTEEIWKKGIDFAVWMEDNFDGNYFMTISADSSFADGFDFPADMTETQYEQYVTYCYASRLLSVNRLTSIMWLGYYFEYPYPQSLFDINIGTPSESYHILGSSHVYTRNFSDGMVLVNPTYNSYSVTIGSGYKNVLTGETVSSTITVQPHTALILKNN